MATPQQQAREHRARLALIAAAATHAVGPLVRRGRPWPEILTTWASYQLAAATAAVRTMAVLGESEPQVNPRAFAGVSSAGFSLAEPLVSTIDYRVPAPTAEPLPPPWWDTEVDSFMAEVEQLIEAEVQDAARSAFQAELFAGPDWTNYVRVLAPPSCKRCAILAGRIYRDNEGFDRHPGCDCQHWPVTSWEEAEQQGLVISFEDLFERGEVRGLSEADERAIRDGADPVQVVNATAGTRQPGITNALTTEVFGRKVKATTYGTTKRSAWRKANPSRPVRLRPESIYRFARDREDALRLLRLYGYLK